MLTLFFSDGYNASVNRIYFRESFGRPWHKVAAWAFIARHKSQSRKRTHEDAIQRGPAPTNRLPEPLANCQV